MNDEKKGRLVSVVVKGLKVITSILKPSLNLKIYY
nr:MAG TPA: hypothetical protein [Caudoviricetes sp.]